MTICRVFQNSARGSARHTARAGVKPFGAVRSHQELHFDYIMTMWGSALVSPYHEIKRPPIQYDSGPRYFNFRNFWLSIFYFRWVYIIEKMSNFDG